MVKNPNKANRTTKDIFLSHDQGANNETFKK